MKKPRFEIGLQFVRYSRKNKAIETIVDILTTTNSKGEVVKIRYITAHDFLGQSVLDIDVNDTTIARSL